MSILCPIILTALTLFCGVRFFFRWEVEALPETLLCAFLAWTFWLVWWLT